MKMYYVMNRLSCLILPGGLHAQTMPKYRLQSVLLILLMNVKKIRAKQLQLETEFGFTEGHFEKKNKPRND